MRKELLFWYNITHRNEKTLTGLVIPYILVFPDASSVSEGGFLVDGKA